VVFVADNLRRAYGDAEDRLSSMMQDMHERGELRHLQGKQLSLEEDDPAWLVTRMLKQEGFSHPLLERRHEVEQQLRAADARIDRIVLRRKRLVEEQAITAPEIATAFNVARRHDLCDYRESLARLNRAIRDYNLTVPLPLQVMPVQIEVQMKRVEDLVPCLEPECFGQNRSAGSWWTRVRRRRHRADRSGELSAIENPGK
jgi:hypothetical protein